MKNVSKMLSIRLLVVILGFRKKDPMHKALDLTKYSIVGKVISGNPTLSILRARRHF